jgi:hypothetical protein
MSGKIGSRRGEEERRGNMNERGKIGSRRGEEERRGSMKVRKKKEEV